MDDTIQTGDAPAQQLDVADQVRTADFGPLVIEYDARVLQPRSWTVLQSQWAAELLRPWDDTAPDAPGVLELCAGAGHIGLLAVAASRHRLVAVDVDPVACAYAHGNAVRAGMGDRVEVRCASLEDAVGRGERFAVVVADPPWVTTGDLSRFPEDPRRAVDGGPDGLDVARACVAVARRHLCEGGSLLVQLGTEDQCDRLAAESTDAQLREMDRRQGERGWVLRLVRPASH